MTMFLDLSPAARAAIRRELESGEMLRIAWAGGCAEVALLLDRQAALELDGALLDYREDEGFLLDHQNWGTSC